MDAEPAESRRELGGIEDLCGDETILLCEDEASVCELTARMLRSTGYQVLTARDHAAALEAITKHAGPIELLITDVIPPDSHGKELSQTLR